MDSRSPQNAKVLLERCESGRIGLTANELTWVTGSEGSNPSLSARESGTVVPDDPDGWPAQAGLPGSVAPTGSGLVRGVCDGRGPLLAADLGVPEEPGRLRQARGLSRCAGVWPRPGRRDGRPRRGQHLRLHRRRPPGVDRHRPDPGRPAPPGRPPGRDRLHGRALRRRAARRPARGRPRGRVRGRAHRPRHAPAAGAVPVTLTAGRRAAAPAPPRRTGSTSWSCPARRPARPGPTSRSPRAATASAASAPSRPSGASSGPVRPRRSWPRSTRCARHRRRRAAPARDRPRRPGPRLLRPRPLGPGPAHPHRQRPVAHRRARPAPCRPGSSAPGCSTSIPPG